jgi:hypothetical protein
MTHLYLMARKTKRTIPAAMKAAKRKNSEECLSPSPSSSPWEAATTRSIALPKNVVNSQPACGENGRQQSIGISSSIFQLFKGVF